MPHPLLLLIVKVNLCLQAKDIDLLNSLHMIQSLKQNISELRLENNFFKNIYNDTVKYCTENQVQIPEVRKRKISTKIDQASENEYFATAKEEEMKVKCFNVVLDDLLSGLNNRFSQETNLIHSVTNILKLEPTQEDLFYLKDVFRVDNDQLKGEIRLLKNIPNIPTGTTSKTIQQWIDFLKSNNRTNIFVQFYNIIILFM